MRTSETTDHDALVRLAEIPAKVALLLESARWSQERRRMWQERHVTRLLHAARSSPFWRERLRGVQRIADVPPLDRATLREHFETLRTGNGAPVRRVQTSGSTGEPVEAEHGPATVGFGAAARLRQHAWFGLPPRELPQASLHLPSAADAPLVRRVRDDPPLFFVNPWRLDERMLPAVHDELERAGGVTLVGGRSNALARWGELYEGSGVDGGALGVELAIFGSEVTFGEQRATVERAFRCRSAEMYGSLEAPMLALECPEGSLHVSEEVVLLEVVRPDGSTAASGEVGEVLVTLLHNTEFPLIRYRLGDGAAMRAAVCPCGRTLACLDVVVAKLDELVVRADGRLQDSRFLRTVYERVADGLLGFHTVQEGIGSFTAHLRLAVRPAPDLESRIAEEISRYLEEPIRVRVELVDDLSALSLRAGKRRSFSSRVRRTAG